MDVLLEPRVTLGHRGFLGGGGGIAAVSAEAEAEAEAEELAAPAAAAAAWVAGEAFVAVDAGRLEVGVAERLSHPPHSEGGRLASRWASTICWRFGRAALRMSLTSAVLTGLDRLRGAFRDPLLAQLHLEQQQHVRRPLVGRGPGGAFSLYELLSLEHAISTGSSHNMHLLAALLATCERRCIRQPTNHHVRALQYVLPSG